MKSLTIEVELRNRNTWLHKIIFKYLFLNKGVDTAYKFYSKRVQVKIGDGEWQRYYDFAHLENAVITLVDEDEESEE